MRFNSKFEYKNYLGNQRIAVIQKAHHKTHTLIQFINNELIDKKIIEWNGEYSSNVRDPYSEDNIHNLIINYNIKASDADLRRILKHSLVTRSRTSEIEALKVIRNVSEDLTKLEVERIVKNLNYAENVLTNADVQIDKYKSLIEKLPRHTSRKEILEKCITEEKPLPSNRRQALLERALERGSNYKGRQYTYKELNQLSRDLERYKTHRLDYETALMENRQADREGYGKINEEKSWIWTTLEKTRHQGMDGETVPLTAKFEVVNEVTGDVDYLLFPNDSANDHNNCSNVCNCQCTYLINKA